MAVQTSPAAHSRPRRALVDGFRLADLTRAARAEKARRGRLRTAVQACASVLGLVLAAAAHAGDPVALDEAACPRAQVRILAAQPEDLRDACAGVHAARAFFAAHGIESDAPFVLKITADLPEESSHSAAGSYLAERHRVYMLPYAAFREAKTWFGVPIDRDLYRSLATHEAAHAIAAPNFAVPNPTIQAEEYVAYVAMFATMPAGLRERALAALPGTGFPSEARITEVFYLFDPMRFGAEAYRHYLKPENGPQFLRRVLDGRALAN